MIARWVRELVWGPFERLSRQMPLVPLRAAVTEVAPRVQRIRIDNGVTRAISRLGGGYDYSVSYLVDDALLIDTGFPWARRSLRRVLIERGADRTLTTVVNTHSHEDHVGNNDLLADLCRPAIYAHPLAVAAIRHPAELPWYRRFMFGPVAPSDVQPAPAQICTQNFRFDVLSLPGHSPDHLCLFAPEQGWLFSGDLYVAPDLDSQLRDADGPAWIASLQTVLSLRPAVLFDAHGTVIEGEDQVRTTLARKLEFLRELQRAVEAASQGNVSLREITQRVFDKKNVVNALSFSDGWMSLLTCSDFSRGNLVMSFLRKAENQ